MSRAFAVVLSIGILSLLVIPFQNCSNKNFTPDPAGIAFASSPSRIKYGLITPLDTLNLGLPTLERVSLTKMIVAGRQDWTLDERCMSDNSYDACLFWKNPVAHRYILSGSSAASSFANGGLRLGEDLSKWQTLGVQIENTLDSTKLTSETIDVVSINLVGAIKRLSLSNGQYKSNYADESSSFATSQLTAYYWLTFMEKELLARTGQFYAKGKSILVGGFDNRIESNAFFLAPDIENPGGTILAGFNPISSGSSQVASEVGLSGEVFVHEMGHANLFHALGSAVAIGAGNTNATCVYEDVSTGVVEVKSCMEEPTFADYQVVANGCNSSQGCMGAIHEGIADFQAFITIPGLTSVGELIANSPAGIYSGKLSRNVRKLSALKMSEFYNSSMVATGSATQPQIGGEVHGMGSGYASILWEIYSSTGVDQVRFEKIFMLHLSLLGGNSTFKEAYGALIAADALVPGETLAPLIEEVFIRKGVTL